MQKTISFEYCILEETIQYFSIPYGDGGTLLAIKATAVQWLRLEI